MAAAAAGALWAVLRGAVRDTPITGAGPWRRALRRLASNRAAMIALAAVAALCVICIAAPMLAPFDPAAQPDIVRLNSRPPSATHLFGTDIYSRDVFSRVLYGSRVSLSVALLAMLLAIGMGTGYGAIAGFYGGRTDAVMMRLIDALLSIPRVLLLIAILGLWGRIPLPVFIALLGLTGWFGVSRLVRGQVLALRDEDFVVSARALGVGDARLLLRHVLPNVLSPILVAATLGIGNVILLEAGLSYLGLGVQQPTASWGNIIQDGGDQIATLWWISLFPGLAIVFTVMAFNTLGDGLRDALDPRIESGVVAGEAEAPRRRTPTPTPPATVVSRQG
jgi:peptide/nickel transport system permease protein